MVDSAGAPSGTCTSRTAQPASTHQLMAGLREPDRTLPMFEPNLRGKRQAIASMFQETMSRIEVIEPLKLERRVIANRTAVVVSWNRRSNLKQSELRIRKTKRTSDKKASTWDETPNRFALRRSCTESIRTRRHQAIVHQAIVHRIDSHMEAIVTVRCSIRFEAIEPLELVEPSHRESRS